MFLKKIHYTSLAISFSSLRIYKINTKIQTCISLFIFPTYKIRTYFGVEIKHLCKLVYNIV